MTADPFVAPVVSETALAFEKFNRENPRVYKTLVALAREWVTHTGSRRVGMRMLFERTRWEIAITTSDPEYKINNNYIAYYARLIMWNEPDLDGVFPLRISDADDWLAVRVAQLAPPP